MQIIHDFEISLYEYHKRGVENEFPDITTCPNCSYPAKLIKHGFYWRNALSFKKQFYIPILRLKCISCSKTFSILPDFLLPYFQYTLDVILQYLNDYFLKGKIGVYYQVLQFYRKRFLRNLQAIEIFFRDKHYRGIVPTQIKEKAIKVLDMISAFPKAKTFAKRFHNHFHQSFMAN